MNWFTKAAPIRLKLLLSYGLLVLFTALVSVTGALIVGPNVLFLSVALVCTVGGAVLGLVFRNANANPYVSTVVRMEALAASDISSPIPFVDYSDCVGRMSRAMLVFQNTAEAQLISNADADASTESDRLMAENIAKLAGGDLTADITDPVPETFAALKQNFNEALSGLRGLIGGVTVSANGIRTGSHEIAQASEDLARRTEGNAASL